MNDQCLKAINEDDPKEVDMNTIMEMARENMMQKERMEILKHELATLKFSSRKESGALQQSLMEETQKVSQLEVQNISMKNLLERAQRGSLVSEPYSRRIKANLIKAKEYEKVKQELAKAVGTCDVLRESLIQANSDRESLNSRLEAGEREIERVQRNMELLKNENEKIVGDKETMEAGRTVSCSSDVADVY